MAAGGGGIDTPVARGELNSYYDTYYSDGVDVQREGGAPSKAHTIERAWAALELPAKPSVIDLGCGEGAVAAELAEDDFFGHLDGYDVSSSGIEVARSRQIPDTSFHVYDGERLPCEDRSYDLAVLSHVVEHVMYPRRVLYEARRVARWVLVEVPLEHHRRSPSNFKWSSIGHINFYDHKTIRLLLQTVGLDVRYQEVFCPEEGVFLADYGHDRGQKLYRLKKLAFRVAPRLAQNLTTYWCVLLAASPEAEPSST